MSNASDKELGMHRAITRRDFLNGIAVTSLAAVNSPLLAGSQDGVAPEQGADYYPPALTGMRGNHEGSYAYAHRLRDGERWSGLGNSENTGEIYDLVVVGGGISGLAAAYFYRKLAGANSRILILDNHDDFGGHAKRNEFHVGDRMVIAHGGTMSIEHPGEYSKEAMGLLIELGIDVRRFYKAFDSKLYSQLGTGMFYDRRTFGQDRFVPAMGNTPWPDFLANSPLSENVRRDIARVYTDKKNYLPGLSRDQKIQLLSKTSYADFLTKICKVTPEALPFFQTYTHDLFTVGIDAVAAYAVYLAGDDYRAVSYPGFDGLDLGTSDRARQTEPYIFHFPDGNASIARMLVRSLIPGAIAGHTMDDVVLARADYGRLDSASSAVRIRLNSTAVHVKNIGAPEDPEAVEIAYDRAGKVQTVRGKNCVLACYNMMIPYICPELPPAQKKALSGLVKAPLVYTHVAISNWSSFHKLGVHQIVSPGSYHCFTMLDFPVSLGDYHFASTPDDPIVLFMLRTPCKPGLPVSDQNRLGRIELVGTPFSTFERNIREQLAVMLGSAGFDPAKDIHGITVNRWAHGYAWSPNPLFDPEWKEGEEPWVIGRRRFGRVTIANSDSGARAETDCAIDQAWRAVRELQKS